METETREIARSFRAPLLLFRIARQNYTETLMERLSFNDLGYGMISALWIWVTGPKARKKDGRANTQSVLGSLLCLRETHSLLGRKRKTDFCEVDQ
jgi:hypothetical protein